VGNNRILKILVLTVLICVSFYASAYATSPATPTGPDIKFSAIESVANGKGYYETEVTPGGTNTYLFDVTNISSQDKTVTFYPSDCIPAQNGGKDFRGPTNSNESVGLWVKEKPQIITLKAGETKQLSLNVEVPVNINPGQYVMFSAIQEEPKTATTETGVNNQQVSTNINVVNKTGIQIVMNYKLTGAQHALTVISSKLNQQPDGNNQLLFYLKNGGTILEKPKGQVTVLDAGGTQVFQSSYSADSIYGGTTAEMALTTNKVFASGDYTINVTTDYQDKHLDQNFAFSVSKQEEQSSVQKLADNGKIELPSNYANSSTSFSLVTIAWVLLITIFSSIVFWILKNKHQKATNNKNLEI
jgi:hypothetical protein